MVAKTRISLNVNAEQLGDSAYFLDFMRQLQPTSITVMHGFGLCEQIRQICPDTKVFFRTDVDKDPDLLKMTPAEFVKRHIEKRHSTPDIYGYILNEPVATQNLSWAALLDWLAEVGYRLASAGLPCVMGNLGPGTIPESEVEKGTFDWYLRMLSDTRHIHYAGYHEYTAILLPFGVGQWPREWLVDKTKVQPKDWPTATKLPMERYHARDNNGNYLYTPDGKPLMRLPPYWHIRRSDWLQIRTRDDLKLPIPQRVLSEYGWDRMPDMTMGGQFNPYNVLQQKYGLVSPHETYRGVSSLRLVFEDYFPELGFDGAVMAQLEWSDQIMPDDVESMHVFTWSYNSADWYRQFGADVARHKLLHKKWIDYANRTTTPPPPPTPTPNPSPDDERWIAAKTTTLKGTANVRERPNTTTAAVVGKITPPGAEIEHIPYLYLTAAEKALATPVGDFEWYLVKVGGVVGWSRSDVISLPVPVVIEPPPEPPLLISQVYKDWLKVEQTTIKDSAFILSELEAFDVLIETLTEAVSGLRAWQREINSAAQARIKTIELILSDMED